MTDLGKAYVQIMPSAKGIAGSISKVIKPEAESAGRGAGQSIATGMSKSLGRLGSTLTKSITLPVVGAATAASGFLLKGGWDRIVGLDSARAQLEGLGYDFQAVERISNLVNESIQGTTMTMADGVSVAAGALAAGVEEGEDLARFIGLVGDAAVGSGRQVNEMGMIFNRVQGMGKLMTQELNMIEDGMPGFSQAMAKHFGVGQAEFREMVTAGEVSSQDFLDVMENFAGGMSDAYSKSWAGIFSRVRSNLAILGEYMLEGMFPDAKEALSDFLETIREEDIRNWARGIGETISQAFTNIIQTIKDAVNWWNSLSDSAKSVITSIAGLLVAAGPLLKILSSILGVVGKVSIAFSGAGTITAGLAKLFPNISAGIGLVGKGFAALSGPIGLAVAAIAGLVAGFIYLWQTNENFRAAIIGIWDSIVAYLQPVIQTVVDFIMGTFGNLVLWWQENNQIILEAAQNVWSFISGIIQGAMQIIWGIMQTIWPLVEAVVRFAWDGIKNVIQGTIEVITGIIQFFSALFTGNWSALWESVKQIVTGAVQAVWGLIQLWIVGKVIGAVKAFAGLLKTGFSSAWNFVRNIFSNSLSWIWGRVSSVFTSISSHISGVMNIIRGVISNSLNAIRGFFGNIFGSLRGVVTNAFGGVRSAVSRGMSRALSAVTNFFSRFRSAGSNLIGNIASGIRGAISKVTGAIGNVLQKARNMLPGSEPKDSSSPIYGLTKEDSWGENIASGILNGQTEVDNAMRRLLAIPADLAIDPLGDLMRYNSDNLLNVEGANRSIQYEVNSQTGRLEQLLNQLANQEQVIVLDSGELVGATYPQYDRVGGSQTKVTERWGRS